MDNGKDTKLQRMNDIKFLTGVSIMALLNLMLIVWNPYVEIPLLIVLIVLNIIEGKRLKAYKLELEIIEENHL